jgi:small-conductance mechanosensitive channel/CRP-like cAMP-binding protein
MAVAELWTHLTTSDVIYHLIYALAVFLALEILFRILLRVKVLRISAPLAHSTFVLIFLLILLTRSGVPTELFGMKLLQSAALYFGFLILFNILDHLIVAVFLGSKRDIKVPVLLHQLIRIALLVLVLFVIISKVFQAKLSTLLVSSAVVSAVIGLALQDALGNVVAGVALHVGKPFKVGDWVSVSDQVGTVIQTSWRATTIRTLEGDYVVLPNGNIARDKIINYSDPNPRHAEFAMVGARYEHPPNVVKEAMIQAAQSSEGVLPEPHPRVWVMEYGDFSIQYKMKYWIENYPLHPDIRDRVMSNIWYQFRRRSIGIPFPIRDVNLFTVTPEQREEEESRRIATIKKHLDQVELFSPLDSEERGRIAHGALVQRYAAGEDIVRQNEEGESFFIITSGEVEISKTDPSGRKGTLARIGPGGFFGEMSLLTGEKRTATVTAVEDTDVVVINKACMASVLEANPAVAQSLSQILERRLGETAEKMAELEKETAETAKDAERSTRLLRRIRTFFHLK